MKKILAVAVGIGLLCSTVYAADMKYGYVDFEKAFNEFYKTKTEDAKLKADLDKKKAELEKKREEINKVKNSAELLGEDAKKAKEKELVEKVKELRELQKQAEEALVKERNEKWLEIYKEIKDVVSKYGKDKGYTFIFDDKALVYKADGYDLTGEVIKILNKDAK
jgi:outer membrane protein